MQQHKGTRAHTHAHTKGGLAACTHLVDLVARGGPSVGVRRFGLPACLVHEQQTKKDQHGAKPPQDCEPLAKQGLAKNSSEEEIRSRVGYRSFQSCCTQSQRLCKNRPHDSIAGDHEKEE